MIIELEFKEIKENLPCYLCEKKNKKQNFKLKCYHTYVGVSESSKRIVVCDKCKKLLEVKG